MPSKLPWMILRDIEKYQCIIARGRGTVWQHGFAISASDLRSVGQYANRFGFVEAQHHAFTDEQLIVYAVAARVTDAQVLPENHCACVMVDHDGSVDRGFVDAVGAQGLEVFDLQQVGMFVVTKKVIVLCRRQGERIGSVIVGVVQGGDRGVVIAAGTLFKAVSRFDQSPLFTSLRPLALWSIVLTPSMRRWSAPWPYRSAVARWWFLPAP